MQPARIHVTWHFLISAHTLLEVDRLLWQKPLEVLALAFLLGLFGWVITLGALAVIAAKSNDQQTSE
jgi:hypothetical protein